jgi:hypothetical protein
VRTLRPAFALLALLGTSVAAGCGERDPCRRLAERDCERHGEDSPICRDARRLAAAADPYLVEVCRKELNE